MEALTPGGAYLFGNPSLRHRLRRRSGSARHGVRIMMDMAAHRRADLDHIRELIDAGAIRPVIDKVYPLEQIVEAHHYVESGMKQGNVVVVVEGHGTPL